MSPRDNLVLMDTDRIHRSLKRMAHEIAEVNRDNRPIIIFGINERGYAVAEELSGSLAPLFSESVHTIQLVMEKADSVDISGQMKEGQATPFVLVADDVIFSGETMFNALKKITDSIDVAEIHTAALIDRGHRKFPVKAEFYAMELPTKLDEHVIVTVDNLELKRVTLSDTGQ